MSVFSPGAAAEGLVAVMRQMFPKCSWGAGRLSLLQLGKPACISLALTHHGPVSPGKLAMGLVEQSSLTMECFLLQER